MCVGLFYNGDNETSSRDLITGQWTCMGGLFVILYLLGIAYFVYCYKGHPIMPLYVLSLVQMGILYIFGWIYPIPMSQWYILLLSLLPTSYLLFTNIMF